MSAPRPRPQQSALLLAEALRKAGIPFVHWKSNGHLAAALAGDTDIDLYVPPEHRELFENTMRSFGALKIKSQPWSSYPDIEDWLVFDHETGDFLHIHQHFALLTGLKRVKHLRLPWGEVLMQNLRTDPGTGWPIPAAEIEFLILLVRIWAKMPPHLRMSRPRIPRHIRDELDWLRSSAEPGRVRELAAILFPAFPPQEIEDLLAQGTPDQDRVISVARRLNDSLKSCERMPWRRALLLAACRNATTIGRKWLRKFRSGVVTGKTVPQGGLMIALLGSDGAGKSTLGGELRKWLRFKLDVHSVYMGSGKSGRGLLHGFHRLLRALAKVLSKAGGQARVAPELPLERPAGFLAKLASLEQLSLMRRKLIQLREARALTGQGSVVLTDRYPQMQFPGLNDGPKIQGGRSFDWAMARETEYYKEAAVLGPDLALKLKVTLPVALERKPALDREGIARKIQIIDQLHLPVGRTVEIDATEPFEKVLLAAKRAIWRALIENIK